MPKVFGKNGERHHKHFKAFFSVQNPLKVAPPKSAHPNLKIDPFLAWIQTVSMAAWDLGKEVSGDEQTIGFKGNHQDKQPINYWTARDFYV